MTTVANKATRKRYFVSTVVNFGISQTAVFRRIFGPIANFRKPEFIVGGSSAERATHQHERAVAIVRDLHPTEWGEASRKLSVQVINDEVATEEAEDAAWHEELLSKFTDRREQP